MPVRPKHVIDAEGLPAARQFTDREAPIAASQSALDMRQPDAHKVLVYYGVGGIGKTSLRKELRRLVETRPGTISAALDFDLAQHRDAEIALFALRKELQHRHRVSFPTFDTAYAVYWQKTHPQTPMTRESFPFLEDSVHLMDIIHLAAQLPITGIIGRMSVLAFKGGLLLKEWWERRGHQELKGLTDMEPLAIAGRLPMYWASDVKAYLSQTGKSAVVFLDTHDALSQAERAEGRLREREAWLVELVAQLPEVLWVLCGREPLRWAESDPEWAESLEQHGLGGLGDGDAQQFLTSCGIEDPAIRGRIVSVSQGVPYYLDLAVDTWFEIRDRRERQPVPDDFAHTRLEVFDRFLRHLTQPEIETLKVLSAPRFWDYRLFKDLVNECHTGFPLTAFSDLCRFSFITEEREAPGTESDTRQLETRTWRIHGLMRQSLQEHQPEELRRHAHRFLFERYSGLIQGRSVGDIRAEHDRWLVEAFYHGRVVLSPHDLLGWFGPAADRFMQAGRWGHLTVLCQELLSALEQASGPDHPDLADCLVLVGELRERQGRYREAEAPYRRALTIRETALGQGNPAVADTRNDLAELLSSLGRYEEAEPLLRQALEASERLLGPDHLQVASSLNNLGVLYYNQGRLDEAQPLLERALAVREKALGRVHLDVAVVLNNLGVVFHERGKGAEAEALYRRSLAIRESLLGPEHEKVIAVLSNLAWVLEDQRKLAEAEGLYRRALSISENMTIRFTHHGLCCRINAC